MLNPETVIGDRYIVKRKLAEGGMAEIYLCTAMGPEGFEKEVVIKRIRSFWGDDDMFVQMFIAEARLASRLNHANIVQIFHFDKHEDTYYLAMEYVNGPSFRDFLRKTKEKNKPLPILMASEVAANIARGLHYAHNLNIVHRDVSPHNILLSFDGNIKLADFGIAKTSTQHTSPGVLKGKFAYMAPEQARGEPVDARTDVFALGIVLWEALTHSRLFEYDTCVTALQALQENLIVQPSRFNNEVPEMLDRIVLKALNRNPAERYQSAQEFERALMNFILQHARSADDTNLGNFLQTVYDDIPLTPQEKKEALTRTYTPPSSTSSPSQKSPPKLVQMARQSPPSFSQPRHKTPTPLPLENPLPVTAEEVEKIVPTKPHKSLAHFLRHPVVIALALVFSAGIGVYGTLHFQNSNASPDKPVAATQVTVDAPFQFVISAPDVNQPEEPLPTKEKPPPKVEETEPEPPSDNDAKKQEGLEIKQEQPPSEPRVPVVVNEARLTLNVHPWAWVSINNTSHGEVSGRKVFRLPPGTHRVRFRHESPRGKKDEVKTIQIRHEKDHKTLTFTLSATSTVP